MSKIELEPVPLWFYAVCTQRSHLEVKGAFTRRDGSDRPRVNMGIEPGVGRYRRALILRQTVRVLLSESRSRPEIREGVLFAPEPHAELSRRPDVETLRMSPIEILIEEHNAIKVILRTLDMMCRMLDSGESVDPDHIEKVVFFIKNLADKAHHMKEEDLLFPAMERAGVSREDMLVEAITTEHDLGRGYVRGMGDALIHYSIGDNSAGRVITENARNYVTLIINHIGVEEGVIFPLAERHLPEDVKRDLAQKFEKIDNEVVGEAKLAEFANILSVLNENYL